MALKKKKREEEQTPVGKDTRKGLCALTKCVYEMAHVSESSGVAGF